VHLSGPGVPKGGDIPFMPTVGPVVETSAYAYAQPWERATEHAESGYYTVALANGVRAELTASERVAWQRYTFPPSPASNVLIDVSRNVRQIQQVAPYGLQDAHIEITGADEVSGWTRGRYPVFFVAQFDRPFTAHGTWQDTDRTPGAVERSGTGVGGWVTFDTTLDQTVTAKVGVSFVDIDGARANLEAEATEADFDGVRAAAWDAWNDALSVVRVEGATDLERISFYTAFLPLAAAPERVHRRRRPLPRDGRCGPRRAGSDALRELRLVGHLQVPQPAHRDPVR
jgi:putative alpha-1,2-mannosidase